LKLPSRSLHTPTIALMIYVYSIQAEAAAVRRKNKHPNN
jgi:hypothetical protein